MIRWREFQGVVLILSFVLLGGCSLFEKTEGVKREVPVRTGQAFVDVYNKNVRKLQHLYINSSITLDYKKQVREEDGKVVLKDQRDIVDGRIWLSQPSKLAIHVVKAGAVDVFWFACDASKYWMADLYNKPRVGYVGRHGQKVMRGGEGMVLPATPKELISLFAFSKIQLSEAQLAGVLPYNDGKYESRGVAGLVVEPEGGECALFGGSVYV